MIFIRSGITLFTQLAKDVVYCWWPTDNGTEFTNHKKISEELDIKYYFAHPYASYERGSIENLMAW